MRETNGRIVGNNTTLGGAATGSLKMGGGRLIWVTIGAIQIDQRAINDKRIINTATG